MGRVIRTPQIGIGAVEGGGGKEGGSSLSEDPPKSSGWT